jgi:hypothetical protein
MIFSEKPGSAFRDHARINREFGGPSEDGKSGAVFEKIESIDAPANAGAFSFLLEHVP